MLEDFLLSKDVIDRSRWDQYNDGELKTGRDDMEKAYMYHILKNTDFWEAKHLDYAVLVPLISVKDEPHLLFQVRSMTLKRQPGEICFPGGKMEPNESPGETARREMHEEMGIAEEDVKIIGHLERVVNMSHEIIYPCLGYVKKEISEIRFNEEVSEVFTVPIEFFLKHKPTEYDITYKADESELLTIEQSLQYWNKIAKQVVRKVYSYQYGTYTIWGLTAGIVYDLMERLSVYK